MSIHFGDSTQIDTAPSSANADDIHPNVDDNGYQYASTTSNNYINAYSLTFTPKKANSKVMLWHGGFVYGYGQNQNQQQNTSGARVRLQRGGSGLGGTYSGWKSQGSTFTEHIVDTANHGGNSVNYNLQLQKFHVGFRFNGLTGYCNTRISAMEIDIS